MWDAWCNSFVHIHGRVVEEEHIEKFSDISNILKSEDFKISADLIDPHPVGLGLV